MRKITFILCALLLVVFVRPATAQSIPTCTTLTMYHNLYQLIVKLRRSGSVFTYAETSQSINGCAIWALVEAWQVKDGVVHENSGVPTGAVKFNNYYNNGDWAQSFSKHYGRLFTVGPKIYAGDRQGGPLLVQIDPPPSAVYNQQDCEYYGYVWDWASGTCQDPYSPIVLDLNHDGIKLTSAADGVHFDLNADGEAEQVAWTREGSDDAWLARDLNGNGTIDNGTELFGNATLVDVGEEEQHRAADGFVALEFLHKIEGSTFDQWIDARDPAYAQLLVWTDVNHNGVSESNELQSAAAAGLLAISTQSHKSDRKDKHGNEFRLWGTAVFTGNVTDKAWDVWVRTILQAPESTNP